MRLPHALAAAALVLLTAAAPASARGGVWAEWGPDHGWAPYGAREPFYRHGYRHHGPRWGYDPASAYPGPYAGSPRSGRAGQACYAGPYMCQLSQPGRVGESCFCPARGGERAWGQVGD